MECCDPLGFRDRAACRYARGVPTLHPGETFAGAYRIAETFRNPRDGSRRSGRDHRLSIGCGCNGRRRTNFSAQAARCNGVERDADHSQM